MSPTIKTEKWAGLLTSGSIKVSLPTLLVFGPQERCRERKKKQKKRDIMRENTVEERGHGSFSLIHQMPKLLLAENKRKAARLCLPKAFVLLPRLWGK
jgi:hypothetical protein